MILIKMQPEHCFMTTAYRKLDLKVETGALKLALKSKEYLFGEYPYRGAGDSPHSQMKDIWLRYKDIKPHLESNDFSTFADKHDSVWYPAYLELPESTKIIFDVLVAAKGHTLGGVLITKLPPGGKIKPHTDSGWHAEYYDKYYVPIENYKGSVFGFEQGDIEPEEGEVYWFDNSYSHWVNNDSEGDRVAMIICLRGNA